MFKMFKEKWDAAEVEGWVAVIALLIGYVGVSFSLISPSGFLFQFLNLIGALGFIMIGYARKVMPTFIFNIVWAIIAIIALVRLLL